MSILQARRAYTGTCFDLPLPCQLAREVVSGAGLAARLSVVSGDLFEDDLETLIGKDYTLSLCFNVLHNLSEAQSRRTLKQLAKVTQPGGKLAVLEWLRDGPVDVKVGASFMLQALFTSPGQSLSLAALTGWLEEAGFAKIGLQEVRSVPGTTLITAIRGQ